VRVGVGIIHKDSSEHPDAYLDILVSRAHEFGINLKRSQPVEYHFGLIPSEMGHAFAGNGIMAVGDAAGQASVLAGEGIRWAMKAGRMAGEVAAEALTANDTSREFLSKYEQRWHARFGRSLKIADAINKKISKWSDDHWDKRLELLKSFTPAQFGRALETDFSAGWSLNLLSNPAFLREGLKGFGERIGL
jgi:digeranylgeranylglycerophospholipid reductase